MSMKRYTIEFRAREGFTLRESDPDTGASREVLTGLTVIEVGAIGAAATQAVRAWGAKSIDHAKAWWDRLRSL